MMKKLMFAVSIMALLSLVGCDDKKEQEPPVSEFKSVTYEAAFNTAPGDSELILKGEYIGENGEKVVIDTPVPFKIELKKFPIKLKHGFKGYIYSAKATVIKGSFSFLVQSIPVGSQYLTEQTSINTSKASGFTPEQVKILTTFEF